MNNEPSKANTQPPIINPSPKRKKFNSSFGTFFSPGPKPSTPRGKRRHAERCDARKQHAQACWL